MSDLAHCFNPVKGGKTAWITIALLATVLVGSGTTGYFIGSANQTVIQIAVDDFYVTTYDGDDIIDNKNTTYQLLAYQFVYLTISESVVDFFVDNGITNESDLEAYLDENETHARIKISEGIYVVMDAMYLMNEINASALDNGQSHFYWDDGRVVIISSIHVDVYDPQLDESYSTEFSLLSSGSEPIEVFTNTTAMGRFGPQISEHSIDILGASRSDGSNDLNELYVTINGLKYTLDSNFVII